MTRVPKKRNWLFPTALELSVESDCKLVGEKLIIKQFDRPPIGAAKLRRHAVWGLNLIDKVWVKLTGA